jgi:PmbA protein
VSGLTREDLLAIGESALEQAGDRQAEVIVVEESTELTRFADNRIHQNVAERAVRLRARLIADNRVGVAEIRGERDGALQRLLTNAEQARAIREPEEVTPLPVPDGGADSPVAYSAVTAATNPEERADRVAVITGEASRRGLSAFGSLSTSTTSTAIVNTNGVRRQATFTQASRTSVVRADARAAYTPPHAVDFAGLDAAGLAAEVIETCERNQNAEAIDPGDYEVVLTPYAMADMLEHLSWTGFNALAKQEHRSFMRIGERLMHESVTIVDDSHDPDVFPFPFDFEGVSTKVTTLIEGGVCRGFVYDTPTALRDGVNSTGHSLPQPNTFGPYARHLVMRSGAVPSTALIEGVGRGLYVTRLWYVRDVHPLRTIITGMTREGTFLIENGRLTRPVRDLRFTQSIIDALAGVRQLSSDRHLELGEDGTAVSAPWVHLGHFNFSS